MTFRDLSVVAVQALPCCDYCGSAPSEAVEVSPREPQGVFLMHVPQSPTGRGEPEILTGPADRPNPRRKNRKSRRNGPAIAAFSVLAAALLGGGALLAVTNGGADGPGAAQVSQSPKDAQDASQDPGSGEGVKQGEKQEPGQEPDVASGQQDATSGGGPGTGTRADAGAGKASESDAGSSGADKPMADEPAKERQSGPRQPDEGQTDPRSDGATGYVAPRGPGK
ncbi:hypothetical protein [Streptosporangium minutum]|uniref:hypothetical protein n=1 Tax=Streptosporangium minutum TaxID=569862 RepID=UPI001056BCE2|nr:hypothetical protein [Streptosporangium minutum]